MASVVSVNISERRGTVKLPVAEARLVPDLGVEGDAHAGNWHRQVSLLASESIAEMNALGGLSLKAGMFAENITTEGICLYELPVGTRLKIGGALTEVTQIGKECHTDCEVKKLVGRCAMPTEGIFVRVLSGGVVRAGDEISVIGGG